MWFIYSGYIFGFYNQSHIYSFGEKWKKDKAKLNVDFHLSDKLYVR